MELLQGAGFHVRGLAVQLDNGSAEAEEEHAGLQRIVGAVRLIVLLEQVEAEGRCA